MRTLKIIIFLTVIASLIAGLSMQHFLPGKQIDEKAYLEEIAPGASFSGKKSNPPHYLSDEGIVAFNTYDITPSVRGYAGPIKILIALNHNGIITGIKIIEHKETRNYVHYMESPEYLSGFLGKSVRDPFETDKDVDGITRATVSVEALAETIRESSRIVASDVLGIDVSTKGVKAATGMDWLVYLLLFSASFSLYVLTRRTRKFQRVRDVILFSSILIVGLWLASPFSILHIFNLLLLRPSSDFLWFAVVLSTILSVIIAGRFYCGWLCPFGALSELIGRLPFRKWELATGTDDTCRDLKYIFLGLSAIIVLASGRPEFGNYETYITLFSFHGNYLTWSLVAIALFANLRIKRFWCRYLCPVAALTGLCSRADRDYVSTHDCPMENKPYPLISECIRCNRCYKSGTEE